MDEAGGRRRGRRGREAEAPPFSGGVTVAAACVRLRDERWENPRNQRLDVSMWKSAKYHISHLKVKCVA